MDAIIIKGVALSFALLGTVATTAMAQDTSQTGGVQLSFDLKLRVEAQDNRSLSPVAPDSSLETVANLSFGLLTETRTQRFSFDFGGKLRALSGDHINVDDGFVEPFLALNYDQSSANARLGLSASLRESKLSDNDILSDDGLDVIRGNGATLRRTLLEAKLDWGDTTSLGFGIFARREDNTYRDGVPTDLGGASVNDNYRNTVGASTRMDFTPAVALNVSLSYSEFSEDTVPGIRETITLNNTLTLARPRGPVTISLGVTSAEEGERISTALGRTLELPSGTLAGKIGATRGVNGDGYLTGAMSYSHSLPRGAVDIGLSRDVASDNQKDNERISTTLNLGYRTELSPLSVLQLDANWSKSEATATNLSSIGATLGATFNRELTPDWSVALGYRHRIRDDDVSGYAHSNTIFLELRRPFVTRF